MRYFLNFILFSLLFSASCNSLDKEKPTNNVSDIGAENMLFYAGLEGYNDVMVRAECGKLAPTRATCTTAPKLRSSSDVKKRLIAGIPEEELRLQMMLKNETDKMKIKRLNFHLAKLKEANNQQEFDEYWLQLSTGITLPIMEIAYDHTRVGALTVIMMDVFEGANKLYDGISPLSYVMQYYVLNLNSDDMNLQTLLKKNEINRDEDFWVMQNGTDISRDFANRWSMHKSGKKEGSLVDVMSGIRAAKSKNEFADVCVVSGISLTENGNYRDDFQAASKKAQQYGLNYTRIDLCDAQLDNCNEEKRSKKLALECFSSQKKFTFKHLVQVLGNEAKLEFIDRY